MPFPISPRAHKAGMGANDGNGRQLMRLVLTRHTPPASTRNPLRKLAPATASDTRAPFLTRNHPMHARVLQPFSSRTFSLRSGQRLRDLKPPLTLPCRMESQRWYWRQAIALRRVYNDARAGSDIIRGLIVHTLTSPCSVTPAHGRTALVRISSRFRFYRGGKRIKLPLPCARRYPAFYQLEIAELPYYSRRLKREVTE